MFYTCNYNIRVTHRNGVVSIFFTRIRSTEGSSADCSLFILSLHAHALHLAISKYCFKSFCMKIWARCIHLSVVFPSECQQDRTLLRNQYYMTKTFLIFDINHQQNKVRPDWSSKNDNANYAPSYHEGLPIWLRLPFFKEIFDQILKRFRLWIVLFWTKTSQRLTLYLLSSHE